MKLSLHLARLRDLALVAVSALVVLLPISPLVMPLAGRDSGVFLYTGWRILNGEVPYLHVWDHKPPLIFFLNAAGLWLVSGSTWGVWLIELAALALAATLGYKLVQRAFGIPAAVVSLALWLASLILVIEGGNRTGEFTLPLQFGCLWLAAGLGKPRHGLLRLVAMGMICGLIFWTKQNAVGIGLAVALYLAISRLRAGDRGRLARELLALATGVGVISGTVIAYFGAHGALLALWQAAFAFNFAYIADGSLSLLRNMAFPLRYLLVTGLLPAALIGYGVAARGWLTQAAVFRDNRPLLSVCLIGLPLELLFFNLSGRPFAHYAMTLLPYLAILAGLAVWAITEHWLRKETQGSLLMAASIGLLLFCAGLRTYFSLDQAAYQRAGARVAEEIRSSTAPTDTVVLWGAETSINFFAQRVSPSRFVYQFPLYHPRFASETMIVEFLDAILAQHPRMIIDTGHPATPMFDFPVQTPAIQERVAAIQSIYRRAGDLAGGTLYEPAPLP